MRYKRVCTPYIWCDFHGEIHEAKPDYYGVGEQDILGGLACDAHNWRRVYIETDDKDETFE